MPIQFVDDLTTYLQTQGHGTKGTDLFKGNAPEAIDNLIVVTDTGGIPNLLNQTGPVENIFIQILARNKRQEHARDKLQAIQDDLHQLLSTSLGNFTVIKAQAIDRPAVIGRDVKERWMLTSNFEILVRS